MSSCYCDYDSPEFYAAATRTARRAHQCEECRGSITLGDRYENVSGKWDGSFNTFKTCGHCVNLRTWVKNNVPCVCWLHGDMFQSLEEAIEGAVYRAPEETHGLEFGYLRRRHAIRLRNRVRDGKPFFYRSKKPIPARILASLGAS